MLGCSPQRVEILSIGTTTEPFHMPKKWQSAGWLTWLRHRHLPRLIMQAQMQGALGITTALTCPTRFLRIDETAAPDRFSLDDTDQIDDLRALGERAAMAAAEKVAQRFLDEPAERFYPYATV